MGGNRKGRRRTYINLLITMLLGGLWHGASLRFILWGAIHGVSLAIHKFLSDHFRCFKKTGSEMGLFGRLSGMVFTFHIVCFGWIFFRADSMQTAWEILSRIATGFHPEVFLQFVTGYKVVVCLMAIGYLFHFMPARAESALRRMVTRSPLLIQALMLVATIFIIIQMKSAGVQPFIYFQF
jgi:D-alanyl-lipoteichoic acid acyltransferase DltB (MBOAT superfamily)